MCMKNTDGPMRIRLEEVARLRVLRGLQSQKKLSAAMGISRYSLSLLLKNPAAQGTRWGTIGKLCRALSCRLEDIIDQGELHAN